MRGGGGFAAVTQRGARRRPGTMLLPRRRPFAPSPAPPAADATREPLASGDDADVTDRRGDAAPGKGGIAAPAGASGVPAPATAAATAAEPLAVAGLGAAPVAASVATRGDAPPSKARAASTQQPPTLLTDDGVDTDMGVRRPCGQSPPGAELHASPAVGAPPPPVSLPSSGLSLHPRPPAPMAPPPSPFTLPQPRRPQRLPPRRHGRPTWPPPQPRRPPRPRQRGWCGG